MNTSQQNIKVSVLVPCYNVEKFLPECLDSIVGQTLKDIEIICINDGSKDSTLNILKDYSKIDNRIKILNKNNTGYGDSMNQGLDLATGEYIGIVESDDFIEPKMFETLYTIATEKDLELARCSYFFYKNGIDTPQTYPFVPKNEVFSPLENTAPFYQSPSIWANIYKKSWLQEKKIRFLPTPGASYQDTSFTFKCYFECKRFLMIDNCFLHYRQHPLSSVKTLGKVFAVCDEWNEIWRWTKNNQQKLENIKNEILEMQMAPFRWNFLRLPPSEERNQFLEIWQKEFKLHLQEGFKFPSNLKLKRIIENKVLFNAPQLYPYFANIYNLLKL